MPFDQPTRNRLARLVGDARTLLSEEFTRQLQHEYGLDPASGDVTDLDKLSHLDDARRETARILRETLNHYLAGVAIPASAGTGKKGQQEALQRIVREQAYTVLNRLAALRMAETRGQVIECVARGHQSRGFQLYAHLAGAALGETGDAYRSFLFSFFDELAVEMPALFDRFSPQGRLFPREASLLRLLDLLDAADLGALWGEDETIGWIYQYFNSSEERRQMRAESQAPRNSRELAVRNQFFTPRYVVQFLTDNTLGRIWYEMTRGHTSLVESCHYLVRRPLEIFLPESGFEGATWDLKAHDLIFDEGWRQLPEDLDWPTIREVALAVDGYDMERQVRGRLSGFTSVGDLANERAREYQQTGMWRGNSLELWLCLFFEQRRPAHWGDNPDGEVLAALQSLYRAWRAALEREAGETDQAALLNHPVYIRPRLLKDPRDIKMLDPACGSMHFGLYSFDLYEIIYAEAWDLEGTLGAGAFLRSEGLKPLRETYADKDALRRDVPRLIVEHNIHGIDIDPRAVQIAGLSLWLRAQRSWQAQGIKPHDRPRIQRSNIVCAEPMPGDKTLLEEFLASLREDRLETLIRRVLAVPANQQVRATQRMADALCDLVRLVWQEMTLAGEAGSLLKIEETLSNAIAAAEAEWSERMPLFRVVEFGLTGDADRVRYPRTVPGEDGADFWQRAEALVLAALQDYAEQAQNGTGYQRRLFALDAARGFAFIDVCRKRYDVVLMNPPYGDFSDGFLPIAKRLYANFSANIYSAFWCRSAELTHEGKVGGLTSRTFLTLSQFEPVRRLLSESSSRLVVIADLGAAVLDGAAVDTCASVVDCRSHEGDDQIVFFRVDHEANRSDVLLRSIQRPLKAFCLNRSVFTALPGLRLFYWAPRPILNLFRDGKTLEGTLAEVRPGLLTGDDFRFLLLWWELSTEPRKRDNWFTFAKGGDYERYYADLPFRLNWEGDGRQVKAYVERTVGSVSKRVFNEGYFFQGGLTFPNSSALGFSVRCLPGNSIISVKGQGIFPIEGKYLDLVLAILNSALVHSMLQLFNPGKDVQAGDVKQLPFALVPTASFGNIQQQVEQIIKALRRVHRLDETSPDFSSLAGLLESAIDENLSVFDVHRILIQRTASRVAALESNVEGEIYRAYGLSREIVEAFANQSRPRPTPQEFLEHSLSDLHRLDSGAFLWLSVSVGCTLGRWDIRNSMGLFQEPDFPHPLTPTPACPPGMLQNTHGLPAAPADVPADYPLRISWPGILVDDPGHPEDIEARVRDALRVIWPDTADAVEQKACQILGISSLRDYFASPNRFFDDHLKRYSKSRRQAPIYWPLSTPSGSYTLWLYYHRLSDQILYSCVNDFVEPKLAEVRSQRSEVQRRSGRSSREEKDLERLASLEAELQDFRDELLRVAAFWKPNLNDGVQITAAPLWRLFQHRQWRQRLKETWEQLEAGEYDWAHLAMSTWPARVVPKCVTDRSLAIAHDIEDVFWVEDAGGWRTLRSPAEEIEAQKARQRSPAREQLRVLLGELTMGRARGLRCDEVIEQLASGQWDDLEVALLLRPEGVAEKCWDDPLLAVTLKVNLPSKRTKAARERFVKERVEAGCPDLAEAVIEGLAERPDRFSAFWSELSRGDHDDFALALALWPDRVVERCAVDVELAERHGLRRFFWVQDGDGVWRPRMVAEVEIAAEVAQRQGYGSWKLKEQKAD